MPSDSDVVVTTPRWVRPQRHPLLAWCTSRAGAPSGSGVLIVAPIGYDYWKAHRSLRVLAEQLADCGHVVMRLDLRGIGDSSGDLWDPDRVGAWSHDIAVAVDALRAGGATAITVVGIRFSALLAACAAPALGVDRLVAWLPVASGRQMMRTLRLLSVEPPDDAASVGGPGSRVFAGSVFSGELIRDIGELTPDKLTSSCPRTLVVDRDDQPSGQPLVDAIQAIGGAVETVRLAGAADMIDVPTEYGQVPLAHVGAIVDWLHAATSAAPSQPCATPEPPPAATIAHRGGEIHEAVVRLGPSGLVAIETRPHGSFASRATVVFLNTGSESHVGSGRVWVELARDLARRGTTALRVDFRGWGESPDDGCAPGRPYDAHVADDVRTIAEALRARGDERVVLVGICAGAWAALRCCWELPLAGVVAFNPQLYFRKGDPIEATMEETRRRRSDEIERIRRWRKRGVWSALDALGLRPPAARWLHKIAGSPFPVALVFARDDDGIEYLRDRLGRCTRRVSRGSSLTITELDGLDHPMHRQWRRHEALAAIESLLDRLEVTA